MDPCANVATPPCSHGGSIEACGAAIMYVFHCVTPPCSHGGSIEAGRRTWRADSSCTPLRRVHTAAPLKRPESARGEAHGARALRRVHTAAPLKRVRRAQSPGRTPALRRVHTAAPLKQELTYFLRSAGLALRRVHTAAPLKHAIGGPRKLCACSTPPCSHGGSIEAMRPVGTGREFNATPPCSHGGSIEADADRRGAEVRVALRRVHTAAPLKLRAPHFA